MRGRFAGEVPPDGDDLEGIVAAFTVLPDVWTSRSSWVSGPGHISLVTAGLVAGVVELDLYLDNGCAHYSLSDGSEWAPVPHCSPVLQARFVVERLRWANDSAGRADDERGARSENGSRRYRWPTGGNEGIELVWERLSAHVGAEAIRDATGAGRWSRVLVVAEGDQHEVRLRPGRGELRYRIPSSRESGGVPVGSAGLQAEFLLERLRVAGRRD